MKRTDSDTDMPILFVPRGSMGKRYGLALLAIIVTGALGTGWQMIRTDRELREDLLGRTRVAAQAVNIKRVKALSGTEADLESPDYLRLKEQFTGVRSAEPKCRFVYLMGRNPDGTVFFFADSEPAGSEDESPAGQIYEEIPAGYLRAFDEGIALAEGPVADRWGTWITSLVPLKDPANGELLAVLGMDVDAKTWRRLLAQSAMLPLSLTLLFVVILLAFARERAAQSQLDQQHRRLEATLHAITDAVISTDTLGRVANMNAVAETLTGWTFGEAQGKPLEEIFNIIDSRTRQNPGDPVRPVLNTGNTFTRTNPILLISRDGSEHQITDSAAPIRGVGDTVIGAVLVFRDVTEEFRMRGAVSKTEARMRAISVSAQDAIVMMDPGGTITFWNPAAERTFGYTRDEALGSNLHDILAPGRYHEAQQKAFEHFRKTGQGAAVGQVVELEGLHKSGREVSVELSLSALQQDDGWHAVGILRDITERKQAEAVLDRERSLFAAGPVFTIEWAPTEGWPVRLVSSNVTAILGYTPEEMTSESCNPSPV